MLWNLGKLVASAYVLLLTVAAGGLVAANMAAFVPAIAEFFFNPEGRATQPATYLRWMHGGWLIGAAFALLGAILRPRRSADRAGEERCAKQAPMHRETLRSPRGVLASAGVGALCCGLLGAMLGGSFLLLWFSLAYSPFSPGWDKSLALKRDQNSSGMRRHWVHTTSHPVALFAFFGPIAAGAVSGAVIGGVGSVMRKSRAQQQTSEAPSGRH
jgi:hypothetical protein